MKKSILLVSILAVFTLPLLGCLMDDNEVSPSVDMDEWAGKWTGPEGTYLMLVPQGEKVNIAIKDLDKERRYEGEPTEEGIEFTRDKQKEIIRAGDGHDTGMKWLMDKTDCLYIKSGEGFCRD